MVTANNVIFSKATRTRRFFKQQQKIYQHYMQRHKPSVYFINVLLIHIHQVDLHNGLFENEYSEVHVIRWSVLRRKYHCVKSGQSYILWGVNLSISSLCLHVILDASRNSASVILKALTCNMFCMYNWIKWLSVV